MLQAKEEECSSASAYYCCILLHSPTFFSILLTLLRRPSDLKTTAVPTAAFYCFFAALCKTLAKEAPNNLHTAVAKVK